MTMMLESGKGRIENFTIDETGGKVCLQGRTNWFQVACNGQLQIYLTQQDYDNYANVRTLTGTDENETVWEAPLAVDTIWMRAVQGSGSVAVTITYASQI